jgi:hypothetical protein
MLTFDDAGSVGSNGSTGSNGGNDDAEGKEKRVRVSEKRIINCAAVDVNQLMPLKYITGYQAKSRWGKTSSSGSRID